MKRPLLLLSALLRASSLCEARKLPAEALGTLKYELCYKWGAINPGFMTIQIQE
jgi:hypothetical protein